MQSLCVDDARVRIERRNTSTTAQQPNARSPRLQLPLRLGALLACWGMTVAWAAAGFAAESPSAAPEKARPRPASTDSADLQTIRKDSLGGRGWTEGKPRTGFPGFRYAPTPATQVARRSSDSLIAKTETPDAVLALRGPKPPAVPAPSPRKIDRAIDRGVAFLLARQNRDGSWGSFRDSRPYNVLAPVPGAHHAFRAATTGLCIAALIEVGDEDPEVGAALDRAEKWMFEHLPDVRRATPSVFYNTWAHAYAIQALVRMHGRHGDDPKAQTRIRKLIEQQIGMLRRYEVVDGGWAYYDFEAHTKKPSGSSISFVTATVLVALDEARQIGCPTPDDLIGRGMASIRRQRKPDYSYCYGEYLKYSPMRGINRPGGSLGRSQVCNVAMRRWGDRSVTDEVLKVWLDRIFARNMWLDIGRKRPVPHESWFQVAGYFFYYGHYYAALCIEELPEAERPFYQAHLARVLLHLQEDDGSWWDFPMYDYHQQYGTAFALMALGRCEPDAGEAPTPGHTAQSSLSDE